MVNRIKTEYIKTMGEWSWNTKILNDKVVKGDDNDCWFADNFAQTQHGPLFGAKKNGKPRMTQVCRILYRDWFNIDCEENEIAHSCGEKFCINPRHWDVKPNKKHGARPNSKKWWQE